MISNGGGWHYLGIRNYQHYKEEFHQLMMVIFIKYIVFWLDSEQT